MHKELIVDYIHAVTSLYVNYFYAHIFVVFQCFKVFFYIQLCLQTFVIVTCNSLKQRYNFLTFFNLIIITEKKKKILYTAVYVYMYLYVTHYNPSIRTMTKLLTLLTLYVLNLYISAL